MTRYRDIHKVCPDTRKCFGEMYHGGLRFCRVLREVYKKDGECVFCKRKITDRTDKHE